MKCSCFLISSPDLPEQTSAITTAWPPGPARCPAADPWSACVPPGLRETNAKWTSVSDATERPASLTRIREMWFASKYLFTALPFMTWAAVGELSSPGFASGPITCKRIRQPGAMSPLLRPGDWTELCICYTQPKVILVKYSFLRLTSAHYFFSLQLHEWQNCTKLSAVWWILLQWRNLSPGPWHQPAFLSVSYRLTGEGKKKTTKYVLSAGLVHISMPQFVP